MIAKKMAMDGIKTGAKLGAKAVGNRIQTLEKAMINKGASPKLVHNISDVLTKGSREGINILDNVARKGADNFIDITSKKVNSVVGTSRKKRKSSSKFSRNSQKRRKAADKQQSLEDLRRIIDSA